MVTNGKKFHTRRSQLISMPVSPSSLPAWYCGAPRALPFRCSSNNAYVHISSNKSQYLYSLCNAPATLLSTLHVPTNWILISTLWRRNYFCPYFTGKSREHCSNIESLIGKKREFGSLKRTFLLPEPSRTTMLRVSHWKQEGSCNSALRPWGGVPWVDAKIKTMISM